MLKSNIVKSVAIGCYLSTLLLSCSSMKPRHSIIQESEDLDFIDARHFEYNYYNLDGLNMEASKRFFSTGRYTKISSNEYQLTSDKFNPDSISINTKIVNKSDTSRLTRIILNTAIDEDRSKEYRIVLHVNSLSLTFSGLHIDTALNLNSQKSITVFAEIILPDFYVNGHPMALYKRIATKPVMINNAQEINITVPITKDYFYFKELGTVKVKDMGDYYSFGEDGRKVRKK